MPAEFAGAEPVAGQPAEPAAARAPGAAPGWRTGAGVTPGTRPVLCDLDEPSAVVTRWEWIIACQATGDVTVGELARRNGLSPHETAHLVGKLIQAGLCAVAPAPVRPPGPPVSPQARSEDPVPPPDATPPALPRRVPGALLPAGTDAAGSVVTPPGYPDAGVIQSPDLPLLRQILDGLRSLR